MAPSPPLPPSPPSPPPAPPLPLALPYRLSPTVSLPPPLPLPSSPPHTRGGTTPVHAARGGVGKGRRGEPASPASPRRAGGPWRHDTRPRVCLITTHPPWQPPPVPRRRCQCRRPRGRGDGAGEWHEGGLRPGGGNGECCAVRGRGGMEAGDAPHWNLGGRGRGGRRGGKKRVGAKVHRHGATMALQGCLRRLLPADTVSPPRRPRGTHRMGGEAPFQFQGTRVPRGELNSIPASRRPVCTVQCSVSEHRHSGTRSELLSASLLSTVVSPTGRSPSRQCSPRPRTTPL